MQEQPENISDNPNQAKLNIERVGVSYGCPNCGSEDIKEIGNNHHQTKNEMEYMEYCKCLKCKHEFVE